MRDRPAAPARVDFLAAEAVSRVIADEHAMTDAPDALLLLDVDGPLNPFRQITRKGYLPPKARQGEQPFEYQKHFLRPPGWETGMALPVLLSAQMGAELARLQDCFTLVWATTWEDAANELLSPILGLPELPVITWPDEQAEWNSPGGRRGSWKTPHILRWLDRHGTGADGRHRPWVWVDDEIGAADRALVRSRYGEQRGERPVVRRWLFAIEPNQGLRRGDLADLRRWAEQE